MKKIAKRWFKISIGSAVTLIGIILMPVPGPGGTPVTLLGLAILSSEVPWAQRILQRLKAVVDSNHILKRNKWLRAGVVTGAISFYALSSFITYRMFSS